MKYYFVLFLFLSLQIFAQKTTSKSDFDYCIYQAAFRDSIVNYNLNIDSIYMEIYRKDQSQRGINADWKNDIINLVQLSVLLELSPHPRKCEVISTISKKPDVCLPYRTSRIVFIHNAYTFTRYFYNIMKKNYEQELVESSDFVRYLQGLVIGEFGYSYFPPPKTPDEEKIKKLNEMLDVENLAQDYPIEDLCQKVNEAVQNPLYEFEHLEKIGIYKSYIIYEYNEKTRTYIKEKTSDIQYLPDSDTFIYLYKLNDSELLYVMPNGIAREGHVMVIDDKEKNIYKFKNGINPYKIKLSSDKFYLLNPHFPKDSEIYLKQ